MSNQTETLWAVFSLPRENTWDSDFIGAYGSIDLAMEPIRQYCRTRFPDLNQSDIGKIIRDNMKRKDDVHRWNFKDGHTGAQHAIFDLVSVKTQ